MTIGSAYLSRLSSDLNGGDLLVLWMLGTLAIAGSLSVAVVYGFPALKSWAAPRWARWKSKQIRRANVPTRWEDRK